MFVTGVSEFIEPPTLHLPSLRRDTGPMAIKKPFVTKWSKQYLASLPSVEGDLLDRVGPAVVARGHYERDEFLAVGRWKSPRPSQHLAANTDADIVDVTRIALGAPTRLQHRILTLLSGVQIPMATALLAVALPDRHTIFDFRSAEALAVSVLGTGRAGDRLTGKRACWSAATLGVSLRTLDRALSAVEQARLPRVASDGGRRRRHVAASELDGVHDERRDLVQRHAVLPARRPAGQPPRRPRSSRRRIRRTGASWRGRTRGGRRGRPDRSASSAPSGVDQPVARPEVTVQPGRRLVGAAEPVEAERRPARAERCRPRAARRRRAARRASGSSRRSA